MRYWFFLFFISFMSFVSAFAEKNPPLDKANNHSKSDLQALCQRDLGQISSGMIESEIQSLCEKVQSLDGCSSEKGTPIYHFERQGTGGQKILAMSLIHGDEGPSGEVTRVWAQRLEKINPRNSWRVILVANPDGFKIKKRTNSRGVDLNRNFPTKEWENSALLDWKTKAKSDPRRYPGAHSASEKETQCLLRHFEEFKPNFIISIHTPIGVLDFDGPRVKAPKSSPLPWSPLGNYPGSLGRYMWKDKNIPVLTIELKGNSAVARLHELDQLQDISGSLAIESRQTSSLNGVKN
ncbi:MAG: DUF2817 domain-containing protein [Bdellovibrionales bacterium]|nr:DUF2817 domain-containing protein [Bdellovibrionales bacterium]